MRSISTFGFVLFWSFIALQTGRAELFEGESGQALLDRAEVYYAEGSFARALPLFERALAETDSASPQRDWLRFRVADTRWRTVAGDDPLQREILVAGRDELIALAAEIDREARGLRPPRLWARIMEAIGDSWWRSPAQTDLSSAWQYYERALNWWAGSTDIERARQAYLDMVWRISDLAGGGISPLRHRGWNPVPFQVYVNALRIATDPEDRARAAYLLAVSRGGSQDQREVGRLLAGVVAELEGTAWYGPLVFAYARWLETVGEVTYDRDGNVVQRPDYAAAVEWYERFLALDDASTSPFFREVNDRLKTLRSVELGVSVRNTFLPQSPLTIHLRWRNVEEIAVRFVRLDWSRDLQWSEPGGSWFQHLKLEGHNVLREVTEPGDGVKYALGQRELEVPDGLPAGLYIVEAEAGEQRARNFLVVSSAVLNGVRDGSLEDGVYYMADGFSGRHLPGGKLYVLTSQHERGKGFGPWVVNRIDQGADGLFLAGASGEGRRNVELFGVVDGQPAYGGGSFLHRTGSTAAAQRWVVYGYADRNAYRPGETAHWKIVTRIREGSDYTVPAGQRVRVEVQNHSGEVLSQSEHRLSSFGSAWGDVVIPPQASLGLYRIIVYDLEDQRNPRVASEALLRVEEYRLPEYRVDIKMQRADGDGVILMGDTVDAVVEVEYYAGGGVPGAEVEVEVRRQRVYTPFRGRIGTSGRDGMPQLSRRPPQGGGGYVAPAPVSGVEGFVLRETFVTDADGRVTFQFQTDPFAGAEAEFVIRAAVADQSRQMVTAQQSVRVSTQAYQAEVESSRRLSRPQVALDLRVSLSDPNDHPVAASGRLRVFRNEWRSHWRNVHGRMVSGQEWRSIQDSPSFRAADWTFIRDGWSRVEVALFEMVTEADGRAHVSFTPADPGYYTVEWVSVPSRGAPVRAQTNFWAADEMTRALNIQPGYNLIYDEDSFRIGDSVPVMVTTPKQNQTVLLSVLGDGFLSNKLVHVGSGPRLVRLDVNRLWAPNVGLLMMAVEDFSLHTDRREIEVPNTPNQITVAMDGLASDYQPGDEVTLNVRAVDYNGRPLVTELSLAVFDESVRAIQSDLVADPLERFFPPRGRHRGSFVSSLNQGRPLVRPLAGDDGVDDTTATRKRGEEVVAEGAVMMRSAAVDSFAPPAAEALGSVASARPAAPGEAMPDLDAVAVRADFRTTAFWAPDLVTGEDGRVSVKFRLPDDLTQWAVVGRGVSRADQFGQGEESFRSSLPLLVRLASPRYLVAGDSSVIRTILRNNTAGPLSILSRIDVSGSLLSRMDSDEPITGKIGSGAELSGDWSVAAVEPGTGVVEVRAVADSDLSDGLERKIPVEGNGIPARVAFQGALDELSERTLRFRVPEFALGSQQVEVFLSASPVAAIFPASRALAAQARAEDSIDAVINRILPLAVVASLADGHSLTLADLTGREDFPEAVQSTLEILASRQLPGGGWSWYPGGPEDLYMSAYAAWGLASFPDGYAVRDQVASRVRDLLDQRVIELDGNINLQAWVLHALAAEEVRSDGRPSRNAVRAFTNLWRNRDRLTVYGRALLTLTAHYFEFSDELEILADNLLNGLVWVNERDGGGNGGDHLAYWPVGERSWRWHGSTVESTAFAMQALARVGTKGDIVDAAARWLLLNRRGAAWKNTRQTAVVINGLAAVAATGLSERAGVFAFSLNGGELADVSYQQGQAPLFTHRITIDPALLVAGENELTIHRSEGDGPLFASGVVHYFSAEQPVVAAGNLSAVKRRKWAVDPVATLLRGYVPRYRFISREEARIVPGSRLETVLIFSVDSDIDYLRIIDPRAAGLESTDPNSGYRYSIVQLDATTAKLLTDGELNPDQAMQRASAVGTARKGGYFQWRDKGLEVHLESITTGIWMLRYSHRAEFPGSYSWLPPQLSAVYVEELSSHGNGSILTISE